jgi:predicted phage baseplate assembly protein
MSDLDTCGCCEDGIHKPELYNPPGQATLDYRISVHSQFMQRMLNRISLAELPDGDHVGSRPLAELTTRDGDDLSIGLMDGWAVVGDVLSFYQERIANEGFLRTATERFSILQMARAIGYELGAGVAAETYLAFKLDESDSTPDSAVIAAGTQVQSLPQKQGELPQTFETVEAFTARVAWNSFRPQLAQPQTIAHGGTELWLEGANIDLEPGDALLIVGEHRRDNPGSERWDLRILESVEPDNERDLTFITWSPGLGHPDPHTDPTSSPEPEVYVFRQRAALFGHNAPDIRTMSKEVKKSFTNDENATQWLNFNIASFGTQRIFLDRVYDKVIQDDWIALAGHTGANNVYTELYLIDDAQKDSRADFALTSQCTRVDLDTDEHLNKFGLRETVVYCEPEPLTMAEQPLVDDLVIGQTVIKLDAAVPGLLPGKKLVLSGVEPQTGLDVAEIVTLEQANATTLALASGLQHNYRRDSAVFNANVVGATHGETVANEALGGGDGASSHQKFVLKKPPLTHVSAETPSGNKAELTVRVNGVAWEQVESLYGLAPEAKSYVVRLDNEANARIVFGDGKMGARLPTGQENVRATYRSGIGLDGNVGAGTLTLLKTRPFGVSSVTNPLAAGGAADPETLDNARENAPLTVKTLDRIVSLQDYEDFARAFAGIGKAAAVELWDGRQELVHVTIASPTGEAVPEDQVGKLQAAMEAARDPARELCIGGFEKLAFSLSAGVLIDEAYVRTEVEAAISTALQAAYAFDERAFGQPVNSAGIISTIQSIPGVTAVDLDKLYINGNPAKLNSLLLARTARFDEASTVEENCGKVQPAQLLLINPNGITLTEMAP